MKNISLFVLGLAASLLSACNEVDDSRPRSVVTFEGESWNALSAVAYGEAYSSAMVADGYEWRDEASSLSSRALVDYTYGAYIRGGMLVSSYNSDDVATYGDYSKDLYVYNPSPSSTTQGGGAEGSDNFLIVVGNYDDFSNGDERAEFFFADGQERKILECQVNSTTYFLNIAQNGNPFSAPLAEDDRVVISATGYDSSGVETATVTKTLARKGEYIKQWTPWDLSALGRVVKVRFNIEGGPMTEWGMTTPKYFAIDNIAIEH
jgi:hypothetical protein